MLSDIQSVDWQSLTLAGERHLIRLRILGPNAELIVGGFINGIEDAEFSIPGHILADIAVDGMPVRELDASVSLAIEALTVLK